MSIDDPLLTYPSLAPLLEGNARFMHGEGLHPGSSPDRIREVSNEQNPHCVVFGCSDSRVPIEVLFDQGLGEVFAVRNAGHILDNVSLASLEYAVAELGVKNLVVLGHQRCGAVGAAIKHLQGHALLPGYLQYIPDAISPHIADVVTNNKIEEAPALHVQVTVERILHHSALIARECAAGNLTVVGAVYSLDTGRVEIL